MKKTALLSLLALLASILLLPEMSGALEKNATILEAQTTLTKKGYDPGPVDGLWGGKTKRALQSFQKDKGLTVTGRLDRETRKRLGLTGASIELLFYYSPTCSHSGWQRPTIDAFEKKHPEITVTRRQTRKLKRGEKHLIEGTEGNPVMAFHEGNNVMRIVGTAMEEGLEMYLKEFKRGLVEARSTGAPLSSVRGNGITCDK